MPLQAQRLAVLSQGLIAKLKLVKVEAVLCKGGLEALICLRLVAESSPLSQATKLDPCKLKALKLSVPDPGVKQSCTK